MSDAAIALAVGCGSLGSGLEKERLKETRMKLKMTKSATVVVLAVVAAAAFGAGIRQFTVPDVEIHQTNLYKAFDELERLGAYVVGEDGEMLGKVSKGIGSDSLGSDFGAGSSYKSNGLFNEYGKYGSPYRSTSAFNDLASSPPQILIKKDGDIYSIGVLTTNSLAKTKGQRINPHLMKAWLKSD